jgi:transcriptional antiterminator NusG
MSFYAIQTRTGSEDRFLTLAAKGLQGTGARLLWPRRNLRIRRKGEWQDSMAAIFSGYVFLQAPSIQPAVYAALKRAPGFARFLLSNVNIVPLGRQDQALLTHFLSFGEVVERSVAFFDEHRRIRIVSGPLRGLEGMIVRVDRRKGRARVRLAMYEDSFEVDFGFDAIDAAPVSAEGKPG